MDFTQTEFKQTSFNKYPHRMTHLANCPNVLRAQYSEAKTFAEVASEMSTRFARETHDGCIKEALRTALGQAAYQLRQARLAADRRIALIIDLAVARVAVAKLEAEAGALTDEETQLSHVYIEQITNGTFTPRRMRDLRDVAVKPADWS